jgi:uncharacterized protein DUF4886
VANVVCTRCWTWFAASAVRCPQCGILLIAADAAAPPTQDQLTAIDSPRHIAGGVKKSPIKRRRLGALLIASVVGLGVGGFAVSQFGLFGNPGCALPGATCTRVLFIGNSYTYVNDLPATFAALAWAGGHRVETKTLATGGSTLAAHVADTATAPMIASEQWNTVVLQDQSQNPALEYYRQNEMDPAARQLVAMSRRAGAQPLFFLTWAHQSGWPQVGLTTYASMQAAIDDGYRGIASELSVPIAPVGDAWQMVVSGQPNPGLWQADGVHPTTAGTYLAACVFYAAIFRQSPVGLSYRDGLSDAEATTFQQVAAHTALQYPGKGG